MGMIMEILEGLWNTTLYYKGIRVNLFGVYRPIRKDNVLRSTLSQMNRKGLVKNISGKWSITNKGIEYVKSRQSVLKKFRSPFKVNSPRNLLIMFDIPESRKAERSWFRLHLIKFGYLMFQKSVWIGPSPLPKEFISYVKDIKLGDSIKSFKLAKPYHKTANTKYHI